MGHNGIQGMPKRGREWVEWSGTAAAAAAAAVATGGGRWERERIWNAPRAD
jgi:hypothetical protein